MHTSPDQPLVTRHSDPAFTLRREILVSGLFKYVAEIQELADGYAFKFRRSELLIRRITDYIVFEGQYSPQLTFAFVAEPNGSTLWLQVRGLESEKEYILSSRSAISLHPPVSELPRSCF